ncbi:uncharacterized protein LOC132608087 [Lycium barbarum]|uniref:uncharacterized protein LOC132608087 n=1 Tax=Lycium barbarum TaxID=112863 RepID=UPI00293F6884|nr:uncharacterized protein LOC132608087 [Lycium barbarum]
MNWNKGGTKSGVNKNQDQIVKVDNENLQVAIIEGEEPKIDLDEESTAQNFVNAAMEGDLSPKQVEKVIGNGRRKPVKDMNASHTTGAYKLESYRRRLGLQTALSNLSGKIWAFIDEEYEVTVSMDTDQQLTLKLFNWDIDLERIATLNGRSADECVFKRLDRCLGNFELQQLFPGLEVSHLIKLGSDHFPLLLEYVVANSFMTFNVKLKKLKKVLSQWSKATYGEFFQNITNLEEVIKTHETLFEADPSHANREKLQKVQAEMTRVLHIEEEYWKQKAGMTCFQEGDKNSKFFHAHVKGRRKMLQLKRIQNSQGQWLETEHEIAEEAVRFYQAQFHETVVPTQFDILKHVPSMVTNEQNEELTADPTMEEIKHAIFGLNNASAGGPDGFTGMFFQVR